MTRQLFILICYFILADCYSQTSCSDDKIKELKKEIKRESQCGQKWKPTYELAQCYKNSNDSIYRKLLNDAIDIIKGCYDHPKDPTIKTFRLFASGEIYFELNDYKSAETYFMKAFYLYGNNGSVNIKPKHIFQFGQCLYYNKNYIDALKHFNAYKLIVPDDKNVDAFIDKCKTEINVR